jgi:hypothetical protein
MPLGKISKSMITAGYQALKRIDDILKDTLLDEADRSQQLADYSGRFYTVCTHASRSRGFATSDVHARNMFA